MQDELFTKMRRGIAVKVYRYVARDASRWDVDTERDTSEFEIAYCQRQLEKVWEEVEFVPPCDLHIDNTFKKNIYS